MALSAGFQLSLELAQTFPVREGIETAASYLLQYARELRKSGSDILAEEDLTAVLGRGVIAPELEKSFKQAVSESKEKPLSRWSELRLESGPGPTMRNAFKHPRKFAMVVQLSLLAWTHYRESLAAALHEALVTRMSLTDDETSSPPSVEDIVKILSVCRTQSCSFSWDFYIRKIDSDLKSAIKGYYFCPEYIEITPATLLGALDYFYIVQKLPKDRKVVVRQASGSITLIIWAHYILGLNVLVSAPGDSCLTFGSDDEIHLTILFNGPTRTNGVEVVYSGDRHDTEPMIQLFNEEETVLLETSPDPMGSRKIDSEERHVLEGIGSTMLSRELNSNLIVSDDDPVYKETAALATALAICASQMIQYDLSGKSVSGQSFPKGNQTGDLALWRVLDAAKLILAGLNEQEFMRTIESYFKFFQKEAEALTADNLPQNCHNYLKKIPLQRRRVTATTRYINAITDIATRIFIFAHVPDVSSCSSMPIVLSASLDMRIKMHQFLKHPSQYLSIKSEDIFHDLYACLAGRRHLPHRACFLCSCYGWSIFFDTVGDKDPALVRRDVVHVQKGTPVGSKTNEHKEDLADGPLDTHTIHTGGTKIIRGDSFAPRTAASVLRRREFWSTRAREFQLLIHLEIQPASEWQSNTQDGPWQETLGCRQMYDVLWHAFLTGPCDHPMDQKDPLSVTLSPSVAIVAGWGFSNHDSNDFGAHGYRVFVLLTRGDPGIRWLALKQAVQSKILQHNSIIFSRDIVLRTTDCCDACAIEQATAMQNHTVLIL